MIKDSRWGIVKEYSGGVNFGELSSEYGSIQKILKYQEVQDFAKGDT